MSPQDTGRRGRSRRLVRSRCSAFEGPPQPIAESVDACQPARGAGVDPAVGRFVAFAELLPIETLEAAARLDADQLLGDQLLDALGIDAERHMDVAGRPGDAGLDVIVDRRIQVKRLEAAAGALGKRLEVTVR